MKAVVAILIACALAGVVANTNTDAAEFNTHDADALEVEFEAAEETGMEVDSEEGATEEATLVDAAEVGAADSVEFEDALDAADATEAGHEQSDEENAADALDSDEADEALDAQEAEAEAEAGAAANAQVKAPQGDPTAAAVQYRCAAEAVKCPDGSAAFSKVSLPAEQNGCARVNGLVKAAVAANGEFSPCCNGLSKCYARGAAIKAECDDAFHKCMLDVCKEGTKCKATAWVLFQSMSIGGCDSWKKIRTEKGCTQKAPKKAKKF